MQATTAVYKRVAIYSAIYSATYRHHNGVDFDDFNDPRMHVRVALDVLRHCYGVTEPDAGFITDVLIDAADWYFCARDNVDEQEIRERGDFWDDDSFSDRVTEAALTSGPSLPDIQGLPCNERDVPREPHVMVGFFNFYSDRDTMLSAARSVLAAAAQSATHGPWDTDDCPVPKRYDWARRDLTWTYRRLVLCATQP
jgi:hypothetical protein